MFCEPECSLSCWIFHGSSWRTHILLLLDEAVYHDIIISSWWMVLLSSALSVQIFCPLDWSISDRRVLKSPNYDRRFIYSSLQFYQFLSHVVWCSIVWHTRTIRIVYLLDYVMLFVPDNSPYFEICSFWNQYSYFCFLSVNVCMVYFSPFTDFNLSVSLYL